MGIISVIGIVALNIDHIIDLIDTEDLEIPLVGTLIFIVGTFAAISICLGASTIITYFTYLLIKRKY